MKYLFEAAYSSYKFTARSKNSSVGISIDQAESCLLFFQSDVLFCQHFQQHWLC